MLFFFDLFTEKPIFETGYLILNLKSLVFFYSNDFQDKIKNKNKMTLVFIT